jgi:putative sigma-54 modulation protein
MKPMGPEEAALQMELLGHDFFLFTNAENGHAAVLYRRRDGNLGLIETSG